MRIIRNYLVELSTGSLYAKRPVLCILGRLATPLTLGLFAVSTISGVALFFHWAGATFHQMHEWLSMVLLMPFVLHMWKNWRPLVGYVRRKTLLLPVIVCVLAALPFAVSGLTRGSAGGPPSARAVGFMLQAPLSNLAPVLKTTPDALKASLSQQGYKVTSIDTTLETIASASGIPATSVLFAALPSSSRSSIAPQAVNSSPR